MNELLTSLIIGLITSVIGGIITHFLLKRSPEIMGYFIDALRSLVEASLDTLHSLVESIVESASVISNSLSMGQDAFLVILSSLPVLGLLRDSIRREPLNNKFDVKVQLEDGTVVVVEAKSKAGKVVAELGEVVAELGESRDWLLTRAELEQIKEQLAGPLVRDALDRLSTLPSSDRNLKLRNNILSLFIVSSQHKFRYTFKQSTPHEAKQIARRSSKIYEATLLKIYSRGHRKEFGDQMACAFEEQCRETLTRHGPLGFLRVWGITVLLDIIAGLRDRFSKSDDSPQKEIQR